MKKILTIMMKPLSIINKFIPKRKNVIVLYSNLGFRDNVKAIYDYLIENNYEENYRIICSVNKPIEWKSQMSSNTKIVNNYIGLYFFLTSKYFFYCFGKYPIMPSKKQIVVNLWHGMPLKKIGNMEEHKANNKYDYFSFVLSTSDFFIPYMMQAFCCNEDRILKAGQPRTDIMFQMNKNIEITQYKNMILWLPTFRQSDELSERNGSSEGFPLLGDEEAHWTEVNNKLKVYNMRLIIKPHPMQNLTDIMLEEFTNITFILQKDLEAKQLDLYKLLSMSDALITDYSSVYFDYLLLNRPIAFTIDDLDTYKSNRGFITQNPEKMMPGCKLKDKKDLIDFIKNIYDKNDLYLEERTKWNKICNQYCTQNNCKNILDKVGIR